MNVSQNKKFFLITTLAVLSLNTSNATTNSEEMEETRLNTVLKCSKDNQCDSILPADNKYAYSVNLGSCGRGIYECCDYYASNPCNWRSLEGTINVRCGTREPVVLTHAGDNAICNVNEEVQIYSTITGSNIYFVYTQLFADKESTKNLWGIAIMGGFIGSMCLATTVAAIAFIIHECRRRAGGDDQPGFFPMLKTSE